MGASTAPLSDAIDSFLLARHDLSEKTSHEYRGDSSHSFAGTGERSSPTTQGEPGALSHRKRRGRRPNDRCRARRGWQVDRRNLRLDALLAGMLVVDDADEGERLDANRLRAMHDWIAPELRALRVSFDFQPTSGYLKSALDALAPWCRGRARTHSLLVAGESGRLASESAGQSEHDGSIS